MIITAAQYIPAYDSNGNSLGGNTSILATIDSVEMHVPLDPANRHYAEIMRQVNEGSLTIAEAD